MCEWEEGHYLEYIEEMESVVRDVLELLRERNPRSDSRLIQALEDLAQECRGEIERFGLWREDELTLGEIVDGIDAKACAILDWFNLEPESDCRLSNR